MGTPNDLIIPKVLLEKYKEKIRIKDLGQTGGVWPVDVRIIRDIKPNAKKYLNDKTINENFDLVLAYSGKNAKVDLAKMGLEAQLPNIKKFRLIGIPVPDFKIKNFELILAQKR